MGRPSNTEQRRAEIREGLLAVMSERGYGGASIAAIARAAGLRSGLVHYHYESKLAILTGLVEDLAAGLDARYRARCSADDSSDERLMTFIDAHVATGPDADQRAVRAWITVSAEALHQPEVRTLYVAALEQRHEELKRLFASALKQRGRSTRKASELAAAVSAAIEGTFHIASAAPHLIPKGSAARTLRRMASGLLDGTDA